LRLVVAEGGKPAKRRRVLPAISKAAGGPMPGVDITDLSALIEIDDLHHVTRNAALQMMLPDVDGRKDVPGRRFGSLIERRPPNRDGAPVEKQACLLVLVMF
jgi:hypothetical protein